jgi:hypothetical protein
VSQKYKGKARASSHGFMYVLSLDFWLLASEPNIGGFEGFDLTNPRGRFGGERFHLAWSQRCNTLPHHSSSRSTQLQEDSTSVSFADRERAHQLRVSSKGGAPFLERDSL